MKKDIVVTLKAGRRVSTPIFAAGSADQQALVARIVEALNGGEVVPKIAWDCMRGFTHLNDDGARAIQKLPQEVREASASAAVMLEAAVKFPAKTLVLAYNFDRHLGEPVVVQGISNLRDLYKQDGRTFVMLAPSFDLPAALQSDVVLLEEALPDDPALGAVLDQLYEDASIKKANEDIRSKAVDATRGLSLFAAEQVMAMSLTPKGIDLDDAWDRKKAAVDQTPGLGLTRGGPTFDDLGGLEAACEFGRRLFKGGEPPRVVVRIDEIEKMLAGSTGGDLSGISQDALGAWLRTMEDEGWDGMIAVGPAGGGKTIFSRALGSTHGIPTLDVDLGAAKGSLVGESEQKARQQLRVIKGLGGSRVFVVATCNKLDVLPPELKRRFRSGTWFFDLPTPEERERIWAINLKKFGLDPTMARPDDTDWTGAEVRNLCDRAWKLGCSLVDAAHFIVPVIKSDPDGVRRLREVAEGRFLSASFPGPYRRDHVPAAPVAPTKGRSLNLSTDHKKEKN